MAEQQVDLFGIAQPVAAATAPTRPAAIELFPTPPTLEWMRRLAASPHGQKVTILVSWLWTGVVVESLSEGSAGRWLLYRDGTIRQIEADAGQFGRCVFMAPRFAVQLHAKRPLVPMGDGGSRSERYRFAAPGETTPAELQLPPNVENCEP